MKMLKNMLQHGIECMKEISLGKCLLYKSMKKF